MVTKCTVCQGAGCKHCKEIGVIDTKRSLTGTLSLLAELREDADAEQIDAIDFAMEALKVRSRGDMLRYRAAIRKADERETERKRMETPRCQHGVDIDIRCQQCDELRYEAAKREEARVARVDEERP